MRFRIIFDKDIVSTKYTKSWFIIDKENCLTAEVLTQISELFGIRTPCHAELEGFLIPDNQVFEKIVKEGEIVNVKLGKYCLNENKNFAAVKKPEKKIVKKESEDSSDSESSVKRVKRQKVNKFIEESSESSSEEIVKPVVKKKNAGFVVKSVISSQPEPEFKPKPKLYNIEDFANSEFESLEIGDEILFKTLELREDNTPGMSDFKLGKILEKSENGVTIKITQDQSQDDLQNPNSTELYDDLYYEKFQQTLEKKMIHNLMKKKTEL